MIYKTSRLKCANDAEAFRFEKRFSVNSGIFATIKDLWYRDGSNLHTHGISSSKRWHLNHYL